MVWRAIAAGSFMPMVFAQGSKNSENYFDVLAENLLSETPLITCGDYLFQQGNAFVQVSRVAKSSF